MPAPNKSLVITRREGQGVTLMLPNGDRCEVTLSAVQSGRKAKIGFHFPESVRINRNEVQERIDFEQHGRKEQA